MIRVAVSGSGQMGRVVLEAAASQPDMEVAGVLEPLGGGFEVRLSNGASYTTESDLGAFFASARPDVIVDFTNAAFTPRLVEAAIPAGVRPVIGTSGISPATAEAMRTACASAHIGGAVIPNFALGAVVLMHLATLAAKYFDTAEVIELHHDQKVDSPSGTALATARLMRAARGSDFDHRDSTTEHIAGARGANEGGVGLHSIRLPGYVASQEVIFGGRGQTLSLRHDTIGRDCYVPGILLAIRGVMEREGLVEGLDSLIGLK